MRRRSLLLMPACAALAACAAMPGMDPLKVTLAGVEPLPGEGMEARFVVKLRVVNPNDASIDYDGLALELFVRGMSLGAGVSDAKGTIPRFGETVLSVPVTVSAIAMLRQAMSFAAGDRGKISFSVNGKLGGVGFGGMRFSTQGEFELPAARSAPAAP
jgi:LEA14-like dessication related protein